MFSGGRLKCEMNKMFQKCLILCVMAAACMAQRPFYGKRPIGYPVLEQTTTSSTLSNDLGNRFGNRVTTTTTPTTQRLPIEAYGDRELVDRLSKLPADNQPFWLLNWKALEEHRKQGHNYHHSQSNFANGLSGFLGQ